MNPSRSDLYHALADALADPPDWMALPGCDWRLVEVVMPLVREYPAVRSATLKMLSIGGESLEARRERYMALFAGPGRSSLRLYESGTREGRLLGASTFAVERWYREAGLEIPGAEMPDHVSLELEFLAYLSENGSSEWAAIEKAFLDQHAARWLPELGRALVQSRDPVYAPIGQLLAGWIKEVCQQLGVPGFHSPRKLPSRHIDNGVPFIACVEDCTLCSFCVQACPSGALTIHENEQATSLVLSPEACIGCGKCARACIAGALIIGQSPVEGRQVLRHSARAVCRSCGAPMVSLAELDYVAARLDHPAWLGYCPDCRANL